MENSFLFDYTMPEIGDITNPNWWAAIGDCTMLFDELHADFRYPAVEPTPPPQLQDIIDLIAVDQELPVDIGNTIIVEPMSPPQPQDIIDLTADQEMPVDIGNTDIVEPPPPVSNSKIPQGHLALPPPKRPRVTMEDVNESVDPPKSTMQPQPVVDEVALYDKFAPQPPVSTIEISTMQQPSPPSLQPINEVALYDKPAPQPPFSVIEISTMQQPSTSSSQLVEYNHRPGKKKEKVPWTEEEHQLFLKGMQLYGEGNWKAISENVLKTKSNIQIASHAQKYYQRCKSNGKRKRRSIHDVAIDPYRMG